MVWIEGKGEEESGEGTKIKGEKLDVGRREGESIRQ